MYDLYFGLEHVVERRIKAIAHSKGGNHMIKSPHARGEKKLQKGIDNPSFWWDQHSKIEHILPKPNSTNEDRKKKI
jgi:hypothetical protein